EKEYGNQQQHGYTHERKDKHRMLVAAIVHTHGDDHRHKASNGPDQLLREEGVFGSETLARHHNRGRKNHDQTDENEQHHNRKRPTIDADTLRHKTLISPQTQWTDYRLLIFDC